MGAWGPGQFENDDALDFLAELDGPDDLETAFAALPPAEGGEVEATEAARAMAAAEIVAAMMGRPGPDCPEDLRARLEAFGAPDRKLVELAREAVSRVLFDSELLDLWAESEACEDWNRSVTDLIDRLNSATGKSTARPAPIARPTPATTCAYCLEPVADEDLLVVSVSRLQEDPINRLDRMFASHIKCFNGKLHPRRMVQHWVFDRDGDDTQ